MSPCNLMIKIFLLLENWPIVPDHPQAAARPKSHLVPSSAINFILNELLSTSLLGGEQTLGLCLLVYHELDGGRLFSQTQSTESLS